MHAEDKERQTPSFAFFAGPSRYSLLMQQAAATLPISIRPALPEDTDGIVRTYLESAEHHASLDPERYLVPAIETITERYREGRQHPPDAESDAVTLVAELNREIIAFADIRLQRSPDPMHRQLLYCHIAEIAVSSRHRSSGIGEQLLHAAEDWGRRRGAEFASLEYLTANTRAASFYHQRMGYHSAHVIAIKPL